MTNSVDIQVADAIVAAIQAATFDIATPLTERSYADFNEPLEGLSAARIDVVPWDCKAEQDTRGTHEYTIETDILIRRRFGLQSQDGVTGGIPNAVVDEMPKLRQDIYELLAPAQPSRTGRLAATPDAAFEECKIMAAMVRPHWKKYRQFTAWLRVTYLWSKAPG